MNTGPPFLKTTPDGVLIAVKVQPRASRSEVAGIQGEELRIRIAAPPVDSAANTELVKFIAKTLKVPKNAVTIERGAKSRHKQVLIRGTDIGHVAGQLGTVNGN